MGEDGKNQLGQRKVVRGEASFFLRPGESLEHGIQNVYVLGEDEGLILRNKKNTNNNNNNKLWRILFRFVCYLVMLCNVLYVEE